VSFHHRIAFRHFNDEVSYIKKFILHNDLPHTHFYMLILHTDADIAQHAAQVQPVLAVGVQCQEIANLVKSSALDRLKSPHLQKNFLMMLGKGIFQETEKYISSYRTLLEQMQRLQKVELCMFGMQTTAVTW